MSNDTHAFLAPSSAALTVACTMSPTMRVRFPQGDTEDTIQGTAAHWVALEAPNTVKVGDVAPNGVTVTQEMLDGRELMQSILPKSGELFIESRVGDPKSDNHGTPDAWWIRDGCCYLPDFKFGHKSVRAFGNWQCVEYLRHIHEDGHRYDRFEIIVVQPRCYSKEPIERWNGTRMELLPYWQKLTTANATARGGFPTATPGAHCGDHYCPGRHACPALKESAFAASVTANTEAISEPSPETVGSELKVLVEAKAVLDARIDALKEYAMATIQGGKSIPGWQIGRTRPRTVWGVPEAEVAAYGDTLGIDLRKPVACITPTQAAKLGLPKGLFAKEIPGSPVLEQVNLNEIQRRLK